MITHFLSTAINQLLRTDLTAKEKLPLLADKVLTLQCTLPIPITLQCTVIKQDISVSFGDQLPSDATISGSPLQLFRVGLLQASSDAFQLDDMVITGDMELAENWLRLFREADIDLEEMLAQHLGDVPAHTAFKLLRGFKTAISKNINSLETSVNDYLHEESDWFPTKDILQTFFDDVDKLRLDTDRLNAKISLISNELKDRP